MSTATLVPETWELTGDDAWRTLRLTGRGQLLRDAFLRMRVADGFSHARSLAFMTSLVLVQGTIALVGLATALGDTNVVTRDRERDPHRCSWSGRPGPHHGREAGARCRRREALRAARSRFDRRSRHGYDRDGSARAGAEPDLRRRAGPPDATEVRPCVPAGGLRRCAPVHGVHRRGVRLSGRRLGSQPSPGRRVDGAALAVCAVAHDRGDGAAVPTVSAPPPAGVVVAGVRLGRLGAPVVRRHAGPGFGSAQQPSFGDTYGPLAGLVALLLWALLSSIAVFYGGAVAAQLEAVRAGAARSAGRREGRRLRARGLRPQACQRATAVRGDDGRR